MPSNLPSAPSPEHAALVEALLALDLLTLQHHTAQAGDRLDPATLRARLQAALAAPGTELLTVQRPGAGLVASGLLWPQPGGASGTWFVGGFNTHPQHRDAGCLRQLMGQVRALAAQRGITRLVSHVYKTNRLSLAFHRRLGFAVTRENDKALQFEAAIADLGGGRP